MKEILKQALKEAYLMATYEMPEKESTEMELDITGVNPFELPKFLESNNVPKNCSLETEIDISYIYVKYEEERELTKYEERMYLSESFKKLSFDIVEKHLTSNGYTRKERDYSAYNEMKKLNLLDLYKNDLWRTLEDYYSIFFEQLD